MADEWTSTRPWVSAYAHCLYTSKLNDTLTPRQEPGHTQGWPQRSNSRKWPNFWKSPLLPHKTWNTPPTQNYPPLQKLTTPYPGTALAFWDGPWSLYGVCFSVNKPTWYPSLCLSLNSFCDETSRTWALSFPGGSVVKNLLVSAEDIDLTPGPGRSYMLWGNYSSPICTWTLEPRSCN